MPVESIETLDLETFLAVARNESIGGAAQELRVSPPSVSVRIAALERKLGAPLFERTTRGSFMTPAGESFREYAKRCLELLHDARTIVQPDSQNTVTLSAPASLGNPLFAPAMGILHSAGIPTNGRVADTAVVIDQVLDGSAHIGITVNGIVPGVLTSQRICRSPVLTIVRPGHPLLEKSSSGLNVDDVVDTPIAVYRWHGEAEALGRAMARYQRPSSPPAVYVGLPTALAELVMSTDYIGIVAEFGVAEHLRRHTVRRLGLDLPSWSVDIDLVYRKNSAQWPAIQVLLDHLRQLERVITAYPQTG